MYHSGVPVMLLMCHCRLECGWQGMRGGEEYRGSPAHLYTNPCEFIYSKAAKETCWGCHMLFRVGNESPGLAGVLHGCHSHYGSGQHPEKAATGKDLVSR